MSVVVRHSGATVTAPPVRFENEHELETILAEQVTLLRTPSDGPLAFVARQVRLADAGTLDLLCVDADGLPVAIEVKLARNATRRAVIAQIVDYLSALTAMTVDELDQEVDGDLEAALNTFNTEDDPGGFERRWKALGANLRAGLARIIVAMDESPSDLGRIVRFLSEHSNLDIRLVTISKYVDAGVGTVYVPNVVVSTEGKAGTPPQKRPTVDPETFMEAWAVSAGPAAALAWGTFCQALESAGIEGLHAGNYPGGSPYYSVDSPVGRIRLVRLADPRVSAAELRDMLHVGGLWDEYPEAAMAREVFRATLLRLVPGAQRAGGANRVYLPVAALQHVVDDVVAAVSTLTSQIASALRDDGDRPVGPTGDGA
jgi:hypothetical protein